MGARRFGIWFFVAASICTGGAAASRGAMPLSMEEQARYADLDSRGLETFTNVDFASYLVLRHRVQLASGQLPDPAAEVGHYAMKAKGQQFRLNAVRFDWTEVDCVNLVHRSLAAALASDWASFRQISDRILHRGGIVDFRERNMSTLGEFLPNTRWLLTDVTESLRAGDEPASDTFTFVVRPKVFVPHPSGDPGDGCSRVLTIALLPR